MIFYGHGLNSTRSEGGRVAARLTSGGYVVAVMEAVEHGDHPSVDPESQLEDALRFLGIDLTALEIDPFAIRGNLNQTTIDRLRLLDLLYRTSDIDGDGIEDVTGQIAYLGVSLGSLLGTSLMALSPDLDAGIFSVGGARMMNIVTDTDQLEQYQPIIDLLVGSGEAFDRLVPVAQHLIDPADPGAWAPHILQNRFDDRMPPSLLVAIGMHDEVVPRAAGRSLARTLGIPHMPPVAERVETLATLDQAPVSGNWADGQRTAAFFQFDRVVRENGRLDRAKHTAVPLSNEGVHQMRAFLDSWATGEVPVIVDPYEALGTPVFEGD
jgi:pimeloyl-ACP methyl ester carboxylesterase